ncbi:S41 family peptidase [Candidatus Leptofilum sp.]|uniref:S41 family peptidase n=1 Tax=Candidatus Leptofilum sp. TaxID=3241576 RepID=UPI003B5C8DC8
MPVQQIDTAVHREVIQKLSEKLKANYVFPDVAEQICVRLQKQLDNGDYAHLTNGKHFAYTLTKLLQSVNQDEHLWVRWHPDPLPDDEGSLLRNEERIVALREQARLENYGIHKVERLAGNVGCVDIRYFYRPSLGSGETAVSAMNFLTHTNALVIDLRQCRGGNPGMVALISSYFFDGEPTHLNSLYWRDEDFTQQYWTLPYVPGQRYGDKPVYLLTSPTTFSAGEEFAYNLQTRQRATLIGEAAGGAAHPGSPFCLHPHFEAFIPLGKAINPITNDNWEGRGVIPDIAITPEKALSAAYRLALGSIIESIGKPLSHPLAKLLDEAQAALAKIDVHSE